MKTVDCPLIGGDIEDTVCYDIHMVVEGMAPQRTAPKEAVQNPDFKKICLGCPNHRED